MDASTPPDRFEARRREMVRRLAARGITDGRVLDAMGAVPRERFVPEALQGKAYDDTALVIEEGQTISQPYVVAFMCQALPLSPADRVLEVGAGSGYAAAVMGLLAREVIALERHPALVALATRRLRALGLGNVRVEEGDGSRGRPGSAGFDAISVAAGGPRIDEALQAQLAPGGRLVMPVGDSPRSQVLVRLTRARDGSVERESLGEVRFVPLIGAGGWPRG